MGRWNKKTNNKKNKTVSSSFSPVERREVLHFLQLYREAATDVANGEATPGRKVVENSEASVSPGEFLVGIPFPAVSSIADQPYFSFPAKLTSQQRRVIHECCQEVDLFHLTSSDDTLYVSLYADGFSFIPHEIKLRHRSPAYGLYRYQPWVCRRTLIASDQPETTSTSQSITPPRTNHHYPTTMSVVAGAQDRIWNLIDQPGDCLRDDRDVLVYNRLHNANLQSLAPPTPSRFHYITTVHQLCTLLKPALESTRELALDVEAAMVGDATVTCLIQLATDDGTEYIIDVLHSTDIWNAVPDVLGPTLADPRIVKIGHALSGLDTRCWHRDFGCIICNAFDTYAAARVLEIKGGLGLAALCEYYGLVEASTCDDVRGTYAELKAEYQVSDWRRRPLHPEQVEYARRDVRYLHRLRWLLMRDMVEPEELGWDESALAEKGPDTLKQEREAAEAWRESMRRWEMEEDGMLEEEEQEGMVSSNEPCEISEMHRDGLSFLRPDDNDDAATFHTAGHNVSGDDDMLFLTPTNSQADPDEDHPLDVSTAKLRLQPTLMRALWLSQEACRDFWSPSSEPHMKNELFISIQTRFRKGEITTWVPSNTQLYEQLVQWRSELAQELHCLASVLLPLDFLVLVSWKRPTTELRLRRLRQELPELLEREPEYKAQLLDIVLRNTIDTKGSVVNDVYFFADTAQAKFEARQKSIESYERLAFRLGVAAILLSGFVGMVLEASRVRRAKP